MFPCMPSIEHDGLVLLFQNRPQLAAELLRDSLHIPIPDYGEAELYSEDATETTPAPRRADAVVVYRPAGKPVLAVVIEVQRGRDTKKRRSWPVYLTSIWARLKCPVMLLVICPNAR